MQSWDVVAKVTDDFWLAHDAANDLRIILSDEAPSPRSEERLGRSYDAECDFLRLDSGYPVFALCQQVDALDNGGARIAVEDLLRRLGAVCKQYKHKGRFDIAPQMAIYKRTTNDCIVLPERVSPLHIARNDVEGDEFGAQVKVVGSLVRGAPAQFVRLIELHGTALDADAPSTQFLTLWTALEGFLPGTRDDATIIRIVDLLEPVLCRQYIPKLLDDMERTLYRMVPEVLDNVLSNTAEGNNPTERLAAVICLASNESQRQHLMAAVERTRNRLLHDRIAALHDKLSTPVHIKQTIADHWTRVGRHLQRMYRTRNTLVHSAETVPYLIAVAENLHAYIDLLIEAVGGVFLTEPNLNSIDLALRDFKFRYEVYEDYVSRRIKEEKEGEKNAKRGESVQLGLSADTYLALLQMQPIVHLRNKG